MSTGYPQVTNMLKRWLTKTLGLDPPQEVCDPRTSKRIQRLEIEIEELRALVEATWARQRKVEGTVHGMRGASRRHPQRDAVDETIDEFRDRMLREGRLTAARAENQHGEH